MLDTVFLFAAVTGGAVMVVQFLLTCMGLGDDGADFGGDAELGGDAGFGGDADFSGEAGEVFDGGDLEATHGDHQNAWSDVDDLDTQHPDSTGVFAVVSFRTLVAAVAFFGISGAAARSADIGPALALLIALGGGLAAMYGVYYLLQSIARLNSSGNVDIGNAIGAHAVVYVPIPPARGGAGKVQFSMQNRIVEYQAVTDDDQRLSTGEAVEVVAINGNDTVEVRRIAAPVEA